MSPITDFNKTSSSDAAITQVEDASTGDTLGITASNEAKVSVTQPLPAGSNNIGSISNVTGTISLPTGASTSALQTSGNSSLGSIDSKTPGLGQAAMSASSPVVIASDQTAVPAQLTDGVGFLSSSVIDTVNNFRALVTISPDRTTTTTVFNALNATVSISLQGNGGASVQLAAGTLIGTISAEQSIDGGTTWIAARFYNPISQLVSSTVTFSSANSLTVLGMVLVQGCSHCRVRVSSFTSGTCNAVMRASESSGFQSTISQDQSTVDSGYTFSIARSVLNMATAGIDNPLILIKNPSGSGKTVYIISVIGGCTVANVSANFNVYANPTITANGTAETISNRNIGSVISSSIQVFRLPTISANGSLMSSFQFGQNTSSVRIIDEYGIRINENNTVLLTGNPLSNNRNAVVTIVWAEQ